MTSTVGVIANPASGKDIRRLVAHASVFGNDEKINILARVLVGLEAMGVGRVLYMPDRSRLFERAYRETDVKLAITPVDGRFEGDAGDTTTAAAAMQTAGVRAIVSLGGDGTNRALARGACDVPLVPISTGTNNVFPLMIEGTVAGLAAGALASGAADPEVVAPRCKVIDLELGDGRHEIALIDAVFMDPGFVGSRAIWATDSIREVVLTRAEPHAVGMAAVGGALETLGSADDGGVHLVLGPGGREVQAAIAPGLVRPVPIARAERLASGQPVMLRGPLLVALDGERELAVPNGVVVRARVTRRGPRVVDAALCLAAARDASPTPPEE